MQRISIVVLLFLMLSMGCATPCKPIVTTEYVNVEVPVTYKLKRPSRPKVDTQQPLSIYVIELTSYTELLEVIIDETNRKVKK